MQSIEEFMLQYFDERVIDERREQAARAPFYEKFHTVDCTWDSRYLTLAMMESEKVLSASSSDNTAEVITTREVPSMKSITQQLRYHLLGNNNRWLIQSVDFWCYLCHGKSGNESCRFC